MDESRVEDPGWPWLVPIELDAKKSFISDGYPLDRFDVDRTLLKSVQRRGHMRLQPPEFELVREAFGLGSSRAE